jgi:hypothetical protein
VARDQRLELGVRRVGHPGLHVDHDRPVVFDGLLIGVGALCVALWLGQLGALAEGPVGAGEGDHVQAVQLGRERLPGGAGGVLDDPDQQQGEPAQHDVGADALFQPVVDRAQVDDLLHVTPAAFDLQ